MSFMLNKYLIQDNYFINSQSLKIVRDDIFPFVGGGSKARKAIAYEKFLCQGGYNAVVTCGGIQSNHNRAMALMCAKNGWKCHLCIQGNEERFFKEKGIAAEIHEIAGSVEIAPSVGMADAIFDIVSSGSTLVTNGLKEVEKVLFSEAVMIANKSLSDEKKKILSQLLFRIEAVERSRGMKYVLLNLPHEKIDEAIRILPGMKSPTILPLAQEGWSSIHVVINERELWDKIEQLKAIGAEDILVLSLEKMIL